LSLVDLILFKLNIFGNNHKKHHFKELIEKNIDFPNHLS